MFRDPIVRRCDNVGSDPEGDEQIEGRELQACLVTFPYGPVDSPTKPDRFRAMMFLDEKSRLVRGLSQNRVDDRWVSTARTDWQYDVPIDRALSRN